MPSLKFRSLLILFFTLILVGFAVSFNFPNSVRADVGVHPILPGGSSIEPQVDTLVQMATEVITMDVRKATQADNAAIQLNPKAYGLQLHDVWYPVVAQVQADFTMRNPTTNTIDLTTWFPLASALESVNWELNPDEIVPRIASFKVAVDGTPIEYTTTVQPNPEGTDKPPLPWASFAVSFSPGKDTKIHISYLLPLTQAVKSSELALYYIFQTGASWSGPIGHAELVLNLPYPASIETLARIPSSGLGLPYSMSDPRAVIPFDGVTDGNRAHWTWIDFEPKQQDDFSIWLMDPDKWQDLENARSSAQANPLNGQVWLILANRYRNLSVRDYDFPSIFSESYLPLGLEAYQKASELLPDHPAPHIGSALLALAPYMRSTNAPLDMMRYVQDELHVARDLEIAYPELVNEGNLSTGLLEDALSIYFGNVTATAEIGLSSTAWAYQTEVSALSLPISLTPTPQSSITPTVTPSPSSKPFSPTPVSSAIAEPGIISGSGQSLLILSIVGIGVLIIAGYWVLKRASGKS